jgi:uncharacterized protein (DUF58 family)
MPLVAALIVGAGLASLAGRTRSQVTVVCRAENPIWRVGDRGLLTFDVVNTGRHASAPMTITSTSPGLQDMTVALPGLAPGESATLGVRLHLHQRRPSLPLTNHLRVHNRLIGGHRSVTSIQTDPEVPAVRPRPDPPPAHVLARFSRPADEGMGAPRRGSADPFLVRQFVAGDPVSSVHWRSTARQGFPVVMERERPASRSLVLLVIGNEASRLAQQAGCGSADSDPWEQAVSRAAGIVQAAQRQAVPVRVISTPRAPAIGLAPTYDAVQDWLAAIDELGTAQPSQLEAAVRAAHGGLVAVLTAEPWLVAEVQRIAPEGSVVDLARPW